MIQIHAAKLSYESSFVRVIHHLNENKFPGVHCAHFTSMLVLLLLLPRGGCWLWFSTCQVLEFATKSTVVLKGPSAGLLFITSIERNIPATRRVTAGFWVEQSP